MAIDRSGHGYWRKTFDENIERYESDMCSYVAESPLQWSCGCLNTYHPRFECPSMSESERAEHKARALANPLFIGYDPASRGGDHSALDVLLTTGEPLYEERLATQGEPFTPELEAANRTIAVLREGIDKANAEIMRLRDELARRPAAFVEPEPDKPNPFRDFTTDRRRMGPL